MASLTLFPEPPSVNHLYRAHGHVVYMTAEGKALKQAYQHQVKSQWKGRCYEQEKLGVRFIIYFPTKRRRDLDNCLKVLQDSLTGLVYADDSQIDELTIVRAYDEKNPRTEIEIVCK